MDPARRATYGLALLVFLISVSVYLITLTPTVPFWDAGEFIAVSNILGIPHPPGTPLYVLLGRIATLIPWRSIAERVNALSALPAAFAIVLTYLTTLKFIRLAMGGSSATPIAGARPATAGAAKPEPSGGESWIIFGRPRTGTRRRNRRRPVIHARRPCAWRRTRASNRWRRGPREFRPGPANA